MSLSKSVPEGLNPRKCKQTKLRERPLVPYIPEKNKVKEEVTKLPQLQFKTYLEKDTTLNFPLWQENGTREAFLLHVTAVLDAMKKRGPFSGYNKAQKAYKEATKAAELVEQHSPDELHIGQQLIRSSNGEPHHGGKAP
jgi:hypothetical protein